jgi:two-component system CheB/CheR fusion protein
MNEPKLRVLVVDDCRDTAESTGDLVRMWGHNAWVAFGAQTALELAAIHRPHVVLLDLMMPVMDGYQLARALRARPELETTVLVVISGLATEVYRRRAAKCGIEEFLPKPADPEVLRTLLEGVATQALVKTVPAAKKTKKLPIRQPSERMPESKPAE